MPTIWVGLEFVRAHLMTGFSWYYLGHTQYRFIELIQISDLVGAYGVSFVVAASAAALAGDLARIPPDAAGNRSRGTTRASSRSAALASAGGAPGGRRVCAESRRGRRSSMDTCGGRRPRSPPARASPSFRATSRREVKHDPSEALSIFNKHYVMTGAAVKYQPDVIVWPETMYRNPLLLKSPDVSDNELLRLAPVDSGRRLEIVAGSRGAPRPEPAGGGRPDHRHRYAGRRSRLGQALQLGRAGQRPTRASSPATTKCTASSSANTFPLKDVLPFLRSFVPYGGNFGIEAGPRAESLSTAKIGGWSP